MAKANDSLDQVDLNEVPRDTLIQVTQPVLQDQNALCLPGDYFIVRGVDTLPFELRAIREAVQKVDPNIAYALLQTRGDIFTVFSFADDIHDGEGICFVAGRPGRATPGRKDNIKLSPITGERVPVSTQRVSELPKNRPLFLASDYHKVSTEEGIRLYKLPEGSKPGTSNPLLSMIYECRGNQFELHEEAGQLFYVTGGEVNKIKRALLDCELDVYIPEEHVAYQRGEVSAEMN